MKKIFVVLTILLSWAYAAECASVANPGFVPEKGRYIVGFEYNSIKERDFSNAGGLVNAKSKQHLAKITYGVLDNLSLLVKTGSSDLNLRNPDASIKSYSGDFAWGLGLKTILLEDPSHGLNLLGEAQYLTFESEEINNTAQWEELQGSLYVCITNNMDRGGRFLEPFLVLTGMSLNVGARFSDIDVEWMSDSEKGELSADDNFGGFVGLDLEFNNNIIFGIETHFSDEETTSATLGFRF